MTKEDFHIKWIQTYPNTVPIPHLLKHDYPERWFRIHSLPESKRYAENDSEWQLLLNRQNEIITDMLGVNTPILLVAGDYDWDNQQTRHITDTEDVFRSYSFSQLDALSLHQLNPEQYDKTDMYRPAFAETVWQPTQHDNLLKEIADDNTRALFVSFDRTIIVAPYDGGIDFLLKDNSTKNVYQEKYRQWLSEQASGL